MHHAVSPQTGPPGLRRRMSLPRDYIPVVMGMGVGVLSSASGVGADQVALQEAERVKVDSVARVRGKYVSRSGIRPSDDRAGLLRLKSDTVAQGEGAGQVGAHPIAQDLIVLSAVEDDPDAGVSRHEVPGAGRGAASRGAKSRILT